MGEQYRPMPEGEELGQEPDTPGTDSVGQSENKTTRAHEDVPRNDEKASTDLPEVRADAQPAPGGTGERKKPSQSSREVDSRADQLDAWLEEFSGYQQEKVMTAIKALLRSEQAADTLRRLGHELAQAKKNGTERASTTIRAAQIASLARGVAEQVYLIPNVHFAFGRDPELWDRLRAHLPDFVEVTVGQTVEFIAEQEVSGVKPPAE